MNSSVRSLLSRPHISTKRHKDILRIATRLFSQYGYKKTNIEDIAQKVGIGKGTVYRYFPSKDVLYISVITESVYGSNEHCSAAFSDSNSLEECLHVFFESKLEIALKNPIIREIFLENKEFFSPTITEDTLWDFLSYKSDVVFSRFSLTHEQKQDIPRYAILYASSVRYRDLIGKEGFFQFCTRLKHTLTQGIIHSYSHY